MRPHPSGLFEHFWVLLILGMKRGSLVSTAELHRSEKQHILPTKTCATVPKSSPGLLRLRPVDHLVLQQRGGPVVTTVLSAGSLQPP